ncbi:MAG TPA: hypothetical protein ENJ75_03035 [Candidatus Kaiserbacteria bacterium]|nr:hypothetical protein [Candidatus Kaiserbacteria bacterium]
MNTKQIYIGITALIIVLLGWSYLIRANDPTIIAYHGIHWHSSLTIKVGSTTIPVPAGIGLGISEKPIHTHDATGKIHMEFSGVVHNSDLMLKNVFKEWGKPMDSFGSNITMTVNNATSTEYGNYVMRDGDKIVLKFN